MADDSSAAAATAGGDTPVTDGVPAALLLDPSHPEFSVWNDLLWSGRFGLSEMPGALLTFLISLPGNVVNWLYTSATSYLTASVSSVFNSVLGVFRLAAHTFFFCLSTVNACCRLAFAFFNLAMYTVGMGDMSWLGVSLYILDDQDLPLAPGEEKRLSRGGKAALGVRRRRDWLGRAGLGWVGGIFGSGEDGSGEGESGGSGLLGSFGVSPETAYNLVCLGAVLALVGSIFLSYFLRYSRRRTEAKWRKFTGECCWAAVGGVLSGKKKAETGVEKDQRGVESGLVEVSAAAAVFPAVRWWEKRKTTASPAVESASLDATKGGENAQTATASPAAANYSVRSFNKSVSVAVQGTVHQRETIRKSAKQSSKRRCFTAAPPTLLPPEAADTAEGAGAGAE